MNSTFFTNFFTNIANTSTNLSTGMSNIVSTIMPLFASLFVVYIIMVAINYWNGSFEGFLTDALKRFFGIAALLALGVNISNYNSTVFPIITDLGESLGNAWTATGGGGGSGQPVPVMLDRIVDQVADICDKNMEVAWNGSQPDSSEAENNPAAGAPTTPTTPTTPAPDDEGYLDKITNAFSDVSQALGGIFTGGITTITNVLVAILQNIMIWVFALIFLCIAAGFLLIAQILLWILAAIAPIFFAFGLFPATRTYFTNWCGQVLSNAFLFLFINILSTMFLSFSNTYLETFIGQLMPAAPTIPTSATQAVTDSAASMLDFAQVGSLGAMFLVFAVVLMKLPDLSSSLFGGLAASGYGNTIRSISGAAKGLGKVAGGGSKTPASGGSVSNGGGGAGRRTG